MTAALPSLSVVRTPKPAGFENSAKRQFVFGEPKSSGDDAEI
jgi:hypothetical protein